MGAGVLAESLILRMQLVAAVLVALVLPATARADEHLLAIKPGGPYAATPGGELARIQKQRPLPNAFGFGDIFGRKVDSGFIQFIYFGRAEGGQAMIRRIDVEVVSTATTMSRTPGFISGQTWSSGHAWGTFSGGSGTFSSTSSGGGQVYGMSPIEEFNAVLPPRAIDFLADPLQPIPLPTGHIIAIHSVEPQRIVYSVTEPKTRGSRQAPPKGAPSGKKPDWVPW